ncbi:unnamed protein product [Trifolium pratense]|uniref:Uncharacterized protein n=1 Tax=Trifolium pratense TaxID=57577 RepID=A0ACB0ILD2_TRIPR|nr:unnamed protein product [Trifolium pratense]
MSPQKSAACNEPNILSSTFKQTVPSARVPSAREATTTPVARVKSNRRDIHFHRVTKMIDDNDLGFFANFLGVFIFVLVIAYHYVVADPKYEGN